MSIFDQYPYAPDKLEVSAKKDTNPKDGIGCRKVPRHVIPSVALAEEALAFTDGGCKYGTHNWRVAGVRASVYMDAIERHIGKWWEGEDRDPESAQGVVHHLGAIRACCAILLDAIERDMLLDDRPPKMKSRWLDFYNEASAQITDSYPDPMKPYTEKDLTD